jgi:anti-sigma factor RsiW
MKSPDSELKLQAYLDGELDAPEAAEVKVWLAREPDAQALLQELRGTSALMAGSELPRPLPESHDFFWSKIQREIERQEPAAKPAAARVSWYAWLQRHFLPISGVALVLCFAGYFETPAKPAAAQFGEMEVASDEMGAYTFRDQQNKMTMIWLYDRNSGDSQVAHPASAASMESE